MIEALGPGTRLGYCTNVHAGADLDSTIANLRTHALGVRERVGAPVLGVGLWLAADAARAARHDAGRLRDCLDSLGLRVFTLNGFPYANFHEPVVKHRVYEPDWGDPRRLAYTLDLINVLDAILPPGDEGSISTLPIGWPGPECNPVDIDAACANLRTVAAHLHELDSRTGRLIHVDIEPEPGCMLQRADDVVRLWSRLVAGGDEASVRRHLRVCHDVCHSGVMFESQQEAMTAYDRAGIRVGKVQVSSAVKLAPGPSHELARAQLATFNEARYLHQTTVRSGSRLTEYSDLPEALAREPLDAAGEWRVHFHVPVNLDSVGALATTRDEIVPAIELALAAGCRHFEVETYAWTVLPEGLRPRVLADGIAEELLWVGESFRGGGGIS